VARSTVRALRFAEAAFGVARDTDQLDAWLDALEQASVVMTNASAGLYLSSPVVPPDRKRAALRELLPSVPETVYNFLSILAHRNQLDLIPEILRVFRRLVNEHRGIEVATVTTAIPIDAAQQAAIAQRLGQRLGKTVVLETRIDPAILGGVVAQVGDDVIDGSVRGRLERLRRRLTA
jgi:F-type H+-transporting ATPase subunit delta